MSVASEPRVLSFGEQTISWLMKSRDASTTHCVWCLGLLRAMLCVRVVELWKRLCLYIWKTLHALWWVGGGHRYIPSLCVSLVPVWVCDCPSVWLFECVSFTVSLLRDRKARLESLNSQRLWLSSPKLWLSMLAKMLLNFWQDWRHIITRVRENSLVMITSGTLSHSHSYNPIFCQVRTGLGEWRCP